MRGIEVHVLEKKNDERGWLTEVLRREQLEKMDFGQFSVFVCRAGAVRGNHYHCRKTEWVCVLKGAGQLCLQDVRTADKEVIILDEQHMVAIKIPPYISHSLSAVGSEPLLVLAYSDEPFNVEEPDTYIHTLSD